jgi:DNA-binding response OmpR family regulator
MAKTILVVDDDPDIRSTVKIIMEKEGYKVVEAEDGDACLRLIAKSKPDLVLLDIMMPGTPVRDVVKKIKGVPILFVSIVAKGDAKREKLLGSKSVVGFVQKPFDIQKLIDSVRKVL